MASVNVRVVTGVLDDSEKQRLIDGVTERARSGLLVPVYVHENGVPLTRHPLQYSHERARSRYFLTQFRAFPIVAPLVRARAFWPSPAREVRRYLDGTLPVPGSPRMVFTPGHTLGHCALHFPDRDAVIAGERSSPSTPTRPSEGRRSSPGRPRPTARATTPSLDALAETGATTVLTGHGEAWKAGATRQWRGRARPGRPEKRAHPHARAASGRGRFAPIAS